MLQSLVNYLMIPKPTQYNSKKKVSDLFTGQLPNEPKINLVKLLTRSVWLNHW